MSLSEATGDEMVRGPVTECTECPRPLTGGSWYACGELRVCVRVGEKVCTSNWSGALGRLSIRGWFLDRLSEGSYWRDPHCMYVYVPC